MWIVLRLYREFLARPVADESTVEALVYELCAYVTKRFPEDMREPLWLPIVDAAVREGFRRPVDLCALASSVGVHPSHLCRAYRRFREHTISEAVVAARVAYVARRLAESEGTLADIADEAGFTDQSHMTRVFKRVTGQPPGKHRHGVSDGALRS